MANHGVLYVKQIAATNVDAWNRTAVSGSDIDDGYVFRLDSQSGSATALYSEVWTTTVPSSNGSTLNNLWMSSSRGVNILYTANGLAYKGLEDDPRNFYVVSGSMISAFKPQVGDIVEMTTDCISGSKASNTFINSADGVYQLAWGATQTSSALSFKYLGDDYLAIGNGKMTTQHVTTYKFVCLAN